MDEHQNKEELILQTAMQVFIDKGWHGAKMQEIADKAGINKALLHYYYRSKEKLYTKIFEFLIWRNLGELFNLFDENLSFNEFLKKFIHSYIDVINKNPKIPMFLMRELSEGGTVTKSVLKNLIDSGRFRVDLPLRKIQKAMDEGIIIKMDPRQIIASVIGSCLFYFIAEPIFKTLFVDAANFDREQFVEERKEAIYKTILFGLTPREKTNEHEPSA